MTTLDRFNKLKTSLQKRQPDLTVLLEGITKPHNLAAVMRTCDAVGALEINAVAEKEALSRRPKASAGCRRWVKTQRHDTIEAAFKALHTSGHQIVIANPGSGSVPYTDHDYSQPTAIVFGTELHGLSDYSVQHADAAIHIPMIGLCESLNVSVSAALILYEAKRQREAQGLYDACRIKESVFESRLFEWTWPKLAHYCREHKIVYPKMDIDTGELLESLPGSVEKPW